VRRWGPPRRADNRTGASSDFARAVAAGLPGVESATRRGKETFTMGGQTFLTVDKEGRAVFRTPAGDELSFVLTQVGRDEVRDRIEQAWACFAPRRLVTTYAKKQKARAGEPPVTPDDVRRIVLALPGAAEGPIWGSSIGFLIGTDKKTRFARFGPGVGNLLPPDDGDDTLVIFRCEQRAALLATRPDRYFTTPHYGEPEEPGSIVTRLSEHRGAAELEELAELLEDAWREVATPELVAQHDASGPRPTAEGGPARRTRR
jgi:hypothetical protein